MTDPVDGTGQAPPDRRSAMEGGRDLAAREVAGIVLSTLAMVFVLRQLGASEYGLVGFGLGVSQYASGLSTLGLNVFLLRNATSDHHVSRQVMTLAGIASVVVSGTILVAAPLAGSFLGDTTATVVMRLVAVCVLLKGLSQIPVALLEREMEFGKIARVDFASLIVYYAVLVPLVYAGWGAVGVWTANAVQIAVTTVAYFFVRPVKPTRRVEPGFARAALTFGVGYQGSTWLYSLRDLAGPIVLPAFAGTAALGIYTATEQIVRRVSFLRAVVWRVALPGISRLLGDREAAADAINRAMLYVALLLGGALALLCATASWLVPLVFSSAWDGVPELLPYLGLAALFAGVFAPHSAALVADGDLKALSIYHAVMVALVWAVAVLATPWLAALGMGLAEVAGCLSYIVLGWFVGRRFVHVTYRTPLTICAVAAAVMFGSLYLSPVPAFVAWCLAAGGVLLVSSSSRSAMIVMLRSLPRMRTSG